MMEFVKFFNGMKMPKVGLGTWLSKPNEVETAVEVALQSGYRHIDTAYSYENESNIGNVLKKWLDVGKVKRSELFIVTKLPIIGIRPSDVSHFLKKSLLALKLDYIDLYLVHCPAGLKNLGDHNLNPKDQNGNCLIDTSTDLISVWKAMEEQVDIGLTKSIGVSNYNIDQLNRTVKAARIKPANIQVELHTYFMQKELVKYCKDQGITVCSYGPLASPGRKALGIQTPDLLNDPVVKKIAEKYNKTSSQILLRYLTQKDIVVIPKSITPERITLNIQLFDFTLETTDIEELESLDKGEEGRTFIFSKYFPG